MKRTREQSKKKDRAPFSGLDPSRTRLITAIKCLSCKNYVSPRICQVFATIPLEIWENRFRHTEPYPGDNGKRFTPKFG